MYRIGRRLFVFFLSLYILTAAGYLASGDEETMYRVSRNLAWGQTLSISQEYLVLPPLSTAGFVPTRPFFLETTSITPGRFDSLYSRSFLGQSLLSLPLFNVGIILDNLWPTWPQLGSRLAVSMLNPILLAGTAWLLFHFIVSLGYSPRLAVIISLAFGLTTMAWPYINTFYPQPATGFCLLLTAFVFQQWYVSREARWGWWLGLGLGMAALIRSTVLIVLPPLALLMFLNSRDWTERFRVAWRAGIPLVISIGLSLFYNWLRFDSPFDSGYYEVAWTTPLLLGLYGLLFSSGKGIFLYTPLLLLALGALPLFFKQHRSLAWLITLWWLAYLAFYAPYNFWTGGFNWGPRFLLPLVAVSLLPCATLLHDPKTRLVLPLFIVLAGLGLLIQFPAVVSDHARYLVEQEQTGDEKFYDRTIFIPTYSPIVQQPRMMLAVWRNFRQPDRRAALTQILQGVDLPPADSPANRDSAQRILQTNVIRLNLPAIWWLHLPLWGVPGWLIAALVAPWGGLLLWSAWGLWPRGRLSDLGPTRNELLEITQPQRDG